MKKLFVTKCLLFFSSRPLVDVTIIVYLGQINSVFLKCLNYLNYVFTYIFIENSFEWNTHTYNCDDVVE